MRRIVRDTTAPSAAAPPPGRRSAAMSLLLCAATVVLGCDSDINTIYGSRGGLGRDSVNGRSRR